ncbi:peptidase [Pradoshia eiseniae]|uniref:Peptidase n=1 Tax=Pradoshia eiseniae TaxID=2064768 RepID=A0A2S7N0P4_9BACI|nr:peptidase [Pradoshia eiseniae]
MKKSFIALNTALLIGFGSLAAIPSASAEKDPAKQAAVDNAQASLDKVQAEIAALNKRIKQVDQAVKDNQAMISSTEKEINSKKKQVKQLETEVAELEKRIEERNEILKQRAVTYQQTNGDASYLEVLLGSSSFGDFIERVGAVSTIVKADRKLMQEAQEDQEALEKKKETVTNTLADLNDKKTELVGMQADILEQQKQNETLKATLKDKEAESKRQLAEAEAQNIDIVVQEVTEEAVNAAAVTTVANASSTSSETTKKDETKKENSPSSSSSSSKPSSSKPSSSSSSSSTSSSKSIQKVVSAGYKYIGNSVYVFGGGRTASDIAAGRFDCSGFVSWAFRQGGYSVPASTSALVSAGTKVSYSNIQVGDMVFFNTYKTNGHVGIYVGNGKFIGSQNSTGVAVADMSSGYWKKTFSGLVVRVR